MVGWDHNPYAGPRLHVFTFFYRLTISRSGCGRDCQFRGICFCARHFGNTSRGTQRSYRVSSLPLRILLKADTDLGIYSAVLGSYFLHERLGILGKLGCAMALLGSLIIVLHAPPDKEIETVEDILEYAIQPGWYLRAAMESRLLAWKTYLEPFCRFPDLLYRCRRLLHCHDI